MASQELHSKSRIDAIQCYFRLYQYVNTGNLDLDNVGVNMKIPSLDEHELADTFPVRLPVWWARYGNAGAHPEENGVSGRRIVLRFEKRFSKIEKLAHRLFGGSKELRRPLDEMNSLLWELCDGTRKFKEICLLMDSTFHEKVAPVQERTALGLRNLERLNCMAILNEPFSHGWPTGPGVSPPNQDLPALPKDSIYDCNPLAGEICEWPEEE